MSLGTRAREHALLSAAFVLTRALLHVAGLRLYFRLDWMFLADPVELRERLVETAYAFHAFPPGMNLLTGVLLKLSPAGSPELTAGLAWGVLKLAALLAVNALYYSGRVSGLSARAAFVLVLGFSLTPPALYFEHLYLYTQPVAALLCCAAALFHHASLRSSGRAWLGFFLLCAAIGWLRSTFHLVWFGGVWLLALGLHPARARSISRAALAPALLLLALYLKNWSAFGVFGSSSWLGANLTQATVARLPEAERRAWIDAGRLSPYADIGIFAPPARYAEHFAARDRPNAPPVLTALERPSSGAANFNHHWFLEINRRRLADARIYLAERPFDYAATVLDNLVRIFGPSTRWHPRDRDASPHAEHRQLLGGYEAFYETVLHRLFLDPIGVYVLLVLPIGLALRRALRELPSPRAKVAARARLVLFCAVQIGWVLGVSSLVTRGEAPRFRFQVEALIWLLAAVGVSAWLARRARRKGRWHARAAAQPGP